MKEDYTKHSLLYIYYNDVSNITNFECKIITRY